VVPGSNGRETASVEPASNGRTAGCNVHDDGDGEAGDDRADELAVTHVCGARAAARLRGPGAAKRVVPVDSNKAAANSSTDAKRCSGSVARACCNAGRRAGGNCIHDSAPGRPGNSPVNTLCNVTASEYTSLRASAGCPSATSGAMYAGVPSTWPARVSFWPSPCSIRAMPKSRSLSSHASGWRMSPTTKQLAGLMSRCTTPRRCAAASAEQACWNHGLDVSHGNGPRARK